MTALRKVFIRNCNLTTLPPRMEQLTEMVDFEISFNRLEEFMVDVGKWEKLAYLHLFSNNIFRYKEKPLWMHPELINLDLSNTSIRLPGSYIYLPSLNFLHIGDNYHSIDMRFNKDAFPSLLYAVCRFVRVAYAYSPP